MAALKAKPPTRQERRHIRHFVDGVEVPSLSERTFESLNPATGEAVASVAFGEAADVNLAVSAAWKAYDDCWRDAPPAARRACLQRLAALIHERADEIGELDALDAGKPLREARNEAAKAAEVLDYAATLPENVRGSVYPVEPGLFSYSQREPYGVVGAIAPWNFPFYLAVWKSAFALAAGNCVVLKMAEQTPISTAYFASLCAEAGLPDGVVNVVHGDGSTGAALVEHPRIPKITFTGSTEVGRKILRASAEHIKSCHLELGGKTPNIVFADADLEQALEGSLFTSYWNAGQVCTSGSRLLVQEEVAGEFVTEFAKRAKALRVGDPFAEKTEIGPLVSEEQLHRVAAAVETGVKEGASVYLDGQTLTLPAPNDRGFFFGPTVFTDVSPEMEIAQHEIFGPVTCVIRFRDEDHAVQIANDVRYALAATIWTRSLDRAHRLAARLAAGVVWTNCPHRGASYIPYEGQKQSGMGEDGGLEALGEFTRLKVNHIAFNPEPQPPAPGRGSV